MSYRDALLALSEGSARQAIAAYRSWVEGLLTRDEAIAYISSAIAAANGRARMLADLRLAAELMSVLGTEHAVAGVEVPDDRERLTQATTTMLATAEESDVPETIVARLAASEPIQAAADGLTDAMVRSGRTRGWTRRLSPNACQLCRWWWREGRTWPAEHRMPTHPGCTCHQEPVFAESIRETQATAKQKGII